MAKHTYIISVNGGCTVKEPFVYSFSRTNGIELHVKKNKARILFQSGTEKTQEQMLAFEVPVWKDAYRKIYLVHALLFDQDIEVKKLTISIDENAVEYDASTEGFPFIYSMISKTPMNLPDSWKSNTFIQTVISKTKTAGNVDLAHISMFAFLSSKGRGFEIDRFTNLWTSMNAFYNWYGELYNKHFCDTYLYSKNMYADLMKKLKKNESKKDISELKVLRDDMPNKKALIKDDAPCMEFLMQSLHSDAKKMSRGLFDQSAKRNVRYDFEKDLSELTPLQMSELYEYAVELLNGRKMKTKDPYAKFAEYANKLSQQLYFFLVFEFPYYCRCTYLHGSKAPILLAYENEFEVKVLRNAGYFLERFLSEKIPDMITGKITLDESQKEVKDQYNANKNLLSGAEKHKEKMEAFLNKVNGSVPCVS